MITVTYGPAGEASPLPNGKSEYTFTGFEAFKDWVQGYVCVHCLVDFYYCNRNTAPSTLKDWLEMGCGCEIYIEDPNDMIDWDIKMQLPDNFMELIDD
jgi:hypothetical protein